MITVITIKSITATLTPVINQGKLDLLDMLLSSGIPMYYADKDNSII